jgi:hypothetical protein
MDRSVRVIPGDGLAVGVPGDTGVGVDRGVPGDIGGVGVDRGVLVAFGVFEFEPEEPLLHPLPARRITVRSTRTIRPDPVMTGCKAAFIGLPRQCDVAFAWEMHDDFAGASVRAA